MRAVVLVLAIGLLQTPKASTPGGTVIDAKTQAPLPFARVLLVKADAPPSGTVLIEADAKGQFSIASAPPGTYRVIAEHDGHLRGVHPAPVTVAAGVVPETISIALTPTAVIAGRVFDMYGAPAPKVYVRAHRVTNDAVVAETVAESRTNDLGEYRLFGLAPGAYGLSAEPYTPPSIGTVTLPGASAASASGLRYIVPTPPCPDCRGEGRSMQALSQLLTAGAFIDPLALTGQSHPRVYFPGTVELAQARPITAEPGARLDDMNLRLVLKER